MSAVLISAAHTVHLDVDVPEPQVVITDGLYEISVPGLYSMQSDDSGQIPAGYYFFPVPPGSDPRLNWSVGSVRELDIDNNLMLASAPVLHGSGLNATEHMLPVPFPVSHQTVSMNVVHLLGSTVAVVRVSPFSYGSPDLYASNVSLELSYEYSQDGLPVEGTMFQYLSPHAEEWWRYRESSSESPFWGKPWARIRVDTNGFFSVTGQELEDSGCYVTGAPSQTLSMFTGPGEMFDPSDPADSHQLYPVAIQVFDGDDGVFDVQDSLVFFGEDLWHWNFQEGSVYRSFHRYDDSNAYWLTWGGENGLRTPIRSVEYSGGNPIEQGIVAFGFEEEVLSEYQNNRTGWVWGFLFENSPGYFYLGSPFGSDHGTVRLGVTNAGPINGLHTVTAELEGVTILDTLVHISRNELFAIEDVHIEAGGNMLKMWNDYDHSAYLDYAELLVPVDLTQAAGYRFYIEDQQLQPRKVSVTLGTVTADHLIFDLTDPRIPVELVDWSISGSNAVFTLEQPGQVRSMQAVDPAHFLSVQSIEPAQPGRVVGTASPAEVIVALPEEFTGSVSLIESLYSSRGLTVFPVTYREIYDEFGQGVSDPGAVRSMVRWALDTWPSPPEQLLLIGDGSDDPLGYSTGYRTIAPIYYEVYSGHCLESFFTTVHAGSLFPEIPYSRIPASTENELHVALQKSVALSDPSVLGPWANTIVLAADDEWGSSQVTEDEATVTCELLADSLLDRSLNIEKLYLIQYPWPPGTTGQGVHPEKPEAAQDLVQLLNSGVTAMAFFGHGSYDQMAQEKLFSSAMMSQLTNAPRFFLYNSFSCNNGEFNLSAGDCLAELLLFHPDGGAAATMACTGGSFSSQNRLLAGIFLGYVLDKQGITTAESFWLSVLGIQDERNLEYAVLGDGGVVFPVGNDYQCYTVPPDSLLRGQVNTVAVEFPSETSYLFRCRESADTVHYVSPLSEDFSIDYLKYGSLIYSGILTTDSQGASTAEFFVPLQADTGSMGRTDATGVVGEILGTGYEWPVVVADNGNHADDTEGPLILLELPQSDGGEIPSVYQNSVLRAQLSDPSGICVLGNDAGSIIICSIDGQYEDVTDLFAFDPGTYTTGSLDYVLPELLPGPHQVRVVARDGMKNTGEGILSFNVLEGEPPLLEDTGVFPNPGAGTRAFFFTTGSAGVVTVKIFTISGRPVWEFEKPVGSGTDQIIWNGLDGDGDLPAAGSYIYQLEFSGSSGSSKTADIMVVTP